MNTKRLCVTLYTHVSLTMPEMKGKYATAVRLFLCFSELRSCVKVEVAVLGSPSLIVLMVSVDVKQY